MPTEATASSRAESRRRSYRSNLHRAFLCSLGVHLALALCVNPGLILHLFRPRVSIGFPGRSSPGDLAPQGQPNEPRVSLVQTHRFRGPVTLVSLAPIGTEPAPDQVDPNAQPSAGAPTGDRSSKGRPGRPRPGQPGDGVVVELDENWVTVPGTGRTAQSERFQTLKIVRPEYPPSAIRAGAEGLVKLAVQVDSSGKVTSVHTMENTAANAELERVSVQAMFLWEFKPYRLGTRPVPFTVLVPFRYRLID